MGMNGNENVTELMELIMIVSGLVLVCMLILMVVLLYV
jgi:hypothetical protein